MVDASQVASTILKRGEEEQRRLKELNSQYAVIKWRGRTLIGEQPVDPTTGWREVVLSSLSDFKAWHLNAPKIGKRNVADWWLAHPQRRQYKGVVFAPGGDVPSYLNLWKGWAVQPVAGDCSPWLNMVHDIICSGDEALYRYVINWCADAVQNPTQRPGVVLALLGKQGAGKGTFARGLGSLYGEHFMHIQNSRQLTGNFNAHLVNALLVFADEALFPGDKAGEGALKALITEPTIPLEYKGKDIIQVRNHMRIVMASNSPWFVPAAMDDRRFTIIEVSESRLQDHSYFAGIEAQMKEGGSAALLHYLLHLSLTENLRKIPETQARLDQQMLTLGADPFMEFWLDRLTDSGWLEDEKTADVKRDYREVAGRRPLRETVFGNRLKKLFPSSRKVRLRNGDGGKIRTPYYQLPPLAQARRDFEKAVGRQFNWEALSSKDEDRDEPM
jgi:hypothetical protein